MPDIIGWSSSEVENFANLVGITLQTSGYGYVVSTNISSGAIIDVTSVLSVELETIDTGSLTDDEGE